MSELLYRDEAYTIIGAAMEVHSVLGRGFLEPIYQEAFEIELSQRGIPFWSQPEIAVRYKDMPLKKKYIADLVCYGKILLELKALDCLSGTEEAQLLNYLKATGLRVGLLINFGSEGKLEWKRFIV